MPALLASLALGMTATPAALAASATCATDGVAASAPPLAAIGQEFPVGPEGGDLHAYDVLASSTSGASTLSVVPLDATGHPDLSAPLESTPVTLPTDYTPTTVAFAKPLRLGEGRYVVVVSPESDAAWMFCSAATTSGGAWLQSGINWARSDTASFALGLDLQPEDLTPPVVTITPPVSPTRAPHVAFTSDDADAAYTCSVDGGAFADCTSPIEPAGLPDGAHAVAVVARDVMDNVSAPATTTFVVDLTPPTATITIAPGNAADHTVTATVALSEPGTFTCAVDGAAVDCGGPSFQFVPPVEGPHTVTVTARDALRNTGESAAGFVADWTAPVVAPVDDIEVPAGAGGDSSRQRPGAVVDFDVTATDNFDAAPAVTCDPASGSFFALGATTVTCTAADASGNPSAPVTFTVTVVPPPADAADIDVAYDPTDDAIDFSETHGGDIAFATRRTIVATAAGHSTRAGIRRPHEVGDQDHLDAAMRFVSLRYDDGPRLRPVRNGYGYRSSERRDGSLKRLVIVAKAGRNMILVKYSAGADRSTIRYLRSGRTLRVVHVDGLAIPHLRTEAGAVVIDLGGG